jgi:hypothetical protein
MDRPDSEKPAPMLDTSESGQTADSSQNDYSAITNADFLHGLFGSNSHFGNLTRFQAWRRAV